MEKEHNKKSGAFSLLSSRGVLVLILVIFIAVASFSIGFNMATALPDAGSFPVYTGSGNDWNASSTGLNGITIKPDLNTICFPSSTTYCDKNIVWDGTNLTVNG